MLVAQVGVLAAGVEAARIAGVQQSAQTASTNSTQRQSNQIAQEADLRKTEVVEESSETDAASSTSNRRLDIVV